jgi:hypothetical protein
MSKYVVFPKAAGTAVKIRRYQAFYPAGAGVCPSKTDCPDVTGLKMKEIFRRQKVPAARFLAFFFSFVKFFTFM